jgi:hypothetical protein
MSLLHRASGSGVACRDFARQFAGITIASMVEAYLLWTAGKRHEDEESDDACSKHSGKRL